MQASPLSKQLRAQFYHKNRLALSIALIGSLAASLIHLIITWLLKQLVDVASGVPGTPSLSTLALLSGGFILLCLFTALIRYYSVPYFIRRAMCQYKNYAFQKLSEKKLSSFREEKTANYLSALTNDANSLEADFLDQQLNLLTKITSFLGGLLLMLWYSPLLTLISIALTILPIVASVLTGNQLKTIEKKVSDRNKTFTASLAECLSGFSVIKSFKAEKEMYQLFVESNRALEETKFNRRRVKLIVTMIGMLAGLMTQLGVFIIGTWMALSGSGLTGGTVILFVNTMGFIIQPLSELPSLLASRKAALGLIDKLAESLEKNPSQEGETNLNDLSKGIRLDKVSFGYEEGKPVLREFSADFEAGKAYAIVGASGSGKSTLLHLLMAGSKDYEGGIYFDDHELRSLSTESLYELTSDIQQNVFVFNASIQENITMFRDFPQAELESVIQRAHLSDLMADRGEHYLCGENGNGLSGGEKQRLSIARSLLKKAKLLLADEATASLDSQTAHQVVSDLLDLQGVTRLVVTHSLDEGLLKRYDKLLVMKDGRLQESGTFTELMALKGYFYALYTVSQ